MSKSDSHSATSAEKTQDEVQIERASLPSTLDLAFERRTVRKVDIRLLPILAFLYAVALIDRTNMAVARVSGMDVDLHLSIGDRYSVVSCLFFVPYIILQLPSNLVLRQMNPVYLLSAYVTTWGAVQLGMGFVKNWVQLLICRLLLGALEAGFFPGMVFIITTWYKRHEVQKRLATFYLTSIVIGGFSSILAYALQLLKGKAGLNGWRWIFILEGIITILGGFLAVFYIPAFPDQNTFLRPEETALILERVDRDRGDALPDQLTAAKVFHHLGDWTMWAYALMFMSATMPSYAISYFITIILASMGWSTKDSLLLTAPPYVVAAVFCFAFAYFSDRTKLRAPFIAVLTLVTITGLAIAGYAKQNGTRYFGLFLVNSGAAGCVPAIITYSANNVVGHSKRSVSTALIVSFGGIGGIFATTVYRQKDFPRYLNGIWATLGCQFLMLVLLGALSITYKRRNELIRAGKLIAEGQPGFYYTL